MWATMPSVWTAPGRVPVEVHDRLWGAEGDEWEVLARETEAVMLAGETVEVPNEAARCLVVALHAAHHGVGKDATLYDLERAIAVADRYVMGTRGRARARGRRGRLPSPPGSASFPLARGSAPTSDSASPA